MSAFGNNANMFSALRGGQFAGRGGGVPDGQMTTQMMPQDGSAPVAPPPGQMATTSIPAAGGHSFGGNNPFKLGQGMFQGVGTVRQPIIEALKAWRDSRPDFATMDPEARRAAIMDWIGGRQGFMDIRQGGAIPPIPGAPGVAPPQGIAVGEPNPAAVSNMAPPGMVGTNLGIPGGYSY